MTIEVAERRASLEVWRHILNLINSGTPMDGLKTIAVQQITALLEKPHDYRK